MNIIDACYILIGLFLALGFVEARDRRRARKKHEHRISTPGGLDGCAGRYTQEGATQGYWCLICKQPVNSCTCAISEASKEYRRSHVGAGVSDAGQSGVGPEKSRTPEGLGDGEQRDPIVEAVREKLLQRSRVGIKKYGTMLDRKDLSTIEWLTHFQEECLDAANYAERTIQELKQSL